MALKSPGRGPIPQAIATDSEDVAWALSTAEAMFACGDTNDALKWLRRAAEAASEVVVDDRSRALQRATTDFAALIGSGERVAAAPSRTYRSTAEAAPRRQIADAESLPGPRSTAPTLSPEHSHSWQARSRPREEGDELAVLAEPDDGEDRALRASQAVRVVVWRAADGLHVAPRGTRVSAISVDAILVALDPLTDLAGWLADK
jgi:hypothetical protein